MAHAKKHEIPQSYSVFLATHDHGANSSDRLSNLSDKIIYHIFSFLDYNDLACVRTLSKKFNLLGTLSPYIFFKPKFDPNNNPSKHKIMCKTFENFLRMLLLKRQREAFAPPIEAIRIHWFSNNNSYYNFFLYNLVKEASEGKSLRELDITIILEPPSTNLVAWQSLISDCRSSLEVLRFDCLYSNDNSFLTWLSSNHAMSFKILTLRSLSMSDLTGYNLDITSTSIQVLDISDVYTSLKCNLNIISTSLKILKMEDISFSWNSNLNIICHSLKELFMNGCHFFKSASIFIKAESLERFVYKCRRDRRYPFPKESFEIYAPVLREVVIVTPKRLALSSSMIAQGPIKQLQAFLTLFLKDPNHNPMGSIIVSTPSLKTLSIEITEWICRITDSDLLHLLRSNPSIVSNGNKFMSILQEKSGKSISFFNMSK